MKLLAPAPGWSAQADVIVVGRDVLVVHAEPHDVAEVLQVVGSYGDENRFVPCGRQRVVPASNRKQVIGTVSLIKTELQLQGGGLLRVASSSCVPEGDNNEGIRLESVHGGNVAGADKCDAQKFGDVAARKRNLDWRSRTGC